MIPLATTTVTVKRPDRTQDRYRGGTANPVTVVAGLRAAITSGSGSTVIVGGKRVAETWVLNTDPADIRNEDLLHDELTGEDYVVNWAVLRPGLGLDHIEGRVRKVQGAF